VLDKAHPLAPGESVLLAPGTSPFPFTAAEMTELIRRLDADPARARSETPHGLLLFSPRD
jgi:hypothetical protein